jgi:RNA polymerase sigma factor (sigma-70 family)
VRGNVDCIFTVEHLPNDSLADSLAKPEREKSLSDFGTGRLFKVVTMANTQELLAFYVKDGSEEAFREIVRRYLDLVYSTALRLVSGDTQLAEDVTQTVFIDLARLARTLSGEVKLGGWLHRHTSFVAATVLRSERRRQAREKQAVEMHALADSTNSDRMKLTRELDDAINRLSAEDRTAIVLRFFERRDFRSIGEALRTNEDAARKRVNRALEKLHSLLSHQAASISTAALAALLMEQAVAAAPAALATSLPDIALAGAAATGGTAFTFLKLVAMTKTKLAFIGIVATISFVTPLVIQHQDQLRLRSENDSLRQKNAQLILLSEENARLSNHLADARSSNSLSAEKLSELMRLRAEATQLRVQKKEAEDQQQQRAPTSARQAQLRNLPVPLTRQRITLKQESATGDPATRSIILLNEMGEPAQSEKLVWNIKDTGGQRYALARISLIGNTDRLITSMNERNELFVEAAMEQLSAFSLEELNKVGFKTVLKSNLLTQFNRLLGEECVQEVLLSEFVMQ